MYTGLKSSPRSGNSYIANRMQTTPRSQVSHSPGQWKKYLPNTTTTMQDETRKKKEEMMKRVEEIQKKVMPILRFQGNSQDEGEDFGWYNKIEQRISKIETNIDLIEKSMEIKMERRLIEAQKEWTQKFEALLSRANKDPKQEKFSNKRPLQKTNLNEVNNYADESSNLMDEEPENEGYFTKRENESGRVKL